jgi:AraC family transcriptional regulator
MAQVETLQSEAPIANHQRAARIWSTQEGAIEASILETASASAVLLDADRPNGRGGEWCSRSVHNIDMCLTQRPRLSRGCFVDSSNEFRGTGRIFLAPAGRRLRFESSPGRQLALGLFLPAGALAHEAEDGEVQDSVLDQCLHIWSESIRTPLRRIAEELRNPGFASPLIVEGLSLVILGELSRLLHQPRPNLASSGGLASWRLNLIEEMVRAEGKPPTLGELAAACRMSTRHLMRAFRKETGLTLGAYVEQVTIERAKQLLRDTRAPIATIATDAGFATAAGFSAAFRRTVGQTPRSFRAREAAA